MNPFEGIFGYHFSLFHTKSYENLIRTFNRFKMFFLMQWYLTFHLVAPHWSTLPFKCQNLSDQFERKCKFHHSSTRTRTAPTQTWPVKIPHLITRKQMLVFLGGKSTSAFLANRIIGTVFHDDVFLNTVHQTPEFLLHSWTRHRLDRQYTIN